MALLAQKVLCIPASETPSGRLFSAAGNVITVKRTSLSPTNVNAILFLNKNHDLLETLRESNSSTSNPVLAPVEAVPADSDSDEEDWLPDLPDLPIA